MHRVCDNDRTRTLRVAVATDSHQQKVGTVVCARYGYEVAVMSKLHDRSLISLAFELPDGSSHFAEAPPLHEGSQFRMVGIVLKRDCDQAFLANPCSATAQAKRAQGRKPSSPSCLVQVQPRWIATCTRPYFLIRASVASPSSSKWTSRDS